MRKMEEQEYLRHGSIGVSLPALMASTLETARFVTRQPSESTKKEGLESTHEPWNKKCLGATSELHTLEDFSREQGTHKKCTRTLPKVSSARSLRELHVCVFRVFGGVHCGLMYPHSRLARREKLSALSR